MITNPTIFVTTLDLTGTLKRRFPISALGTVQPPHLNDIRIPRVRGKSVRVLSVSEVGNGKQSRSCR